MTIRLLLVDDHSVVRQGLRLFLKYDPELEVVGEAADGMEALRLARALKPDVVLMDLLMPIMDGITATAAIRRELPDTEVLALTSVLEDASVVGAVRAGAIGYLLKDTQAEARLMQAVSAPESPEALTERETEVLRRLSQGQSNKQIARRLHNTEPTIKSHVSRILSKLGVQSRTQATLYAIRTGLVSPGSVEQPE
jgi:two-component system, NarL family, response regulator LiaR